MSAVLAIIAGLVSVAASWEAAAFTVLITGGGFVALTAGLIRASRGWIAAGAVGMIVGIMLSSIAGGWNPIILVGAVGTIGAWDFAERAVRVGEQLGREAGTTRNEAVHAGLTIVVGVIAIGIGLAVAAVNVGPIPLPAFSVGLLAVIILVSALHAG